MNVNSTRQGICGNLVVIGREPGKATATPCPRQPVAPEKRNVSLICVNHNAAAWLSRLFESLERQAFFGRREFLFIDNTSADVSRVLCEQFASRHCLANRNESPMLLISPSIESDSPSSYEPTLGTVSQLRKPHWRSVRMNETRHKLKQLLANLPEHI